MKEDIESQKTRVTLKSHEFFVTYIYIRCKRKYWLLSVSNSDDLC